MKLLVQFTIKFTTGKGANWSINDPVSIFSNPTDIPSKPEDLTYIEKQYGLTGHQVVIELFRINGGKPGYYLANLRDRKYYYCGPKWSDIRSTLQSLGIGKPDSTKEL